MDVAAYAVIVFIVTAAAIAHFTLLILKTDRNADFSYHTVAAPAFVAYGFGTAFFLVLAVLWFLVRRHFVNGFAFLAMAVLAGGSLATQILLARKFDFTEDASYLTALLPVTVAILVAAILFLVGVFLAYGTKRRRETERLYSKMYFYCNQRRERERPGCGYLS